MLLIDQGASADGPFTPTFTLTLDEVAPDDPDILPADDECPVGAACKSLWWAEVPDGEPRFAISGILPSSIFSFAGDDLVPDGAIVGKVEGIIRWGPIGECATSPVLSWEGYWLDGTTDASTTTGSSSDFWSFSNWPTQLNDVKDGFLAANPGSVLKKRAVAFSPSMQVANALFFAQPDGSISYVVLGESTVPPTSEGCGPSVVKSVFLGLSADNPDTPEDEGGIPLQTCIAAGTQTFRALLDRNDTPPGDPVILDDTAVCSPNTPAGNDVSVPLNGGTEALAGVEVTFSDVASGGTTSVITTTTGPPPLTGFKIVGLAGIPLYFDINTDVPYSGEVTVCMRYDETQVAGPESGLKLMHQVDGGFDNITVSVDTANDIICGETTTLSLFAIMASVPVGGIVELVTDPVAPPAASQPSDSHAALTVALGLGAMLVLGAGGLYVVRMRRR